jgi:hypothetical protein
MFSFIFGPLDPDPGYGFLIQIRIHNPEKNRKRHQNKGKPIP